MGSYSEHRHDEGGTSYYDLSEPAYAMLGEAVLMTDTGLFGRVRLLWRCCGALLVESLYDAESPDTYTTRTTVGNVAPIPWGTPYCVPCVGAEWSLDLPCGHLTGEGCDCATIAAEAADQDDEPEHTCEPGINYGCDVPDCDNGD